MLTGETTTPGGERDDDAEHPPDHPPDPATLCYARLRAACDGDLTTDQRSAIRELAKGPLRSHIRSLGIALEALDGPDPEAGLIYLLDSITMIRRTLTALDGRLGGSVLSLVTSVAAVVHLLP